MTAESTEYGVVDEVLLVGSLGLVLVGAFVFGFIEMVMGTAHLSQRVPHLGVVIVYTSVDPQLRAAIMAAGFVGLAVWGCFRFGRAIRVE